MSSKLNTLPTDTIIAACQFLSPHDQVKLGLTCRTQAAVQPALFQQVKTDVIDKWKQRKIDIFEFETCRNLKGLHLMDQMVSFLEGYPAGKKIKYWLK